MYVLGRETEHLVKLRFGRDVPTNVEAAGHVVECNRTYACDEDTVK